MVVNFADTGSAPTGPSHNWPNTTGFSGRKNYRDKLDHRGRTNLFRTGVASFWAIPVVPAQVVAGRRPAKTCTGTTGIAQNLKKRCGTNLRDTGGRGYLGSYSGR